MAKRCFEDSWESAMKRVCRGLTTFLLCMFVVGSVSSLNAGENARSTGKSGAAASEMAAQPSSEDDVSAVATQCRGNLYALLVGVSQYSDKSIPPLTVAAQDAQDFAGFLESQKEVFKATKVTLLLNREATKAALERYLFYELKKAGKNDAVFLFLSGHGAIDPKHADQFYFLTYDADPDALEATAVNMTGLRFLKQLDCPRVVLVADACHAGGFSKWRTKAAVAPIKKFVSDFSSSSGRVIVTSSRSDEYSLEMPKMRNSLFTHYFLHGLKGAADRNNDGVVTINEAYNYVYDRTKTESEGAQHPQFEGTVEGVFPLAITPNLGNTPPTVLELLVDPPGAEVFVGGRLVGTTNPDGSMYMKYLPTDRPVPVKVAKAGWEPKTIGPFHFSEKKLSVIAPKVSLKPAMASVEIRTIPGLVTVRLDGKEVGQTSSSGRLIVHGAQVGVQHLLELQKEGFEDESATVTPPIQYAGKKYESDPIELTPKAAPAIQALQQAREAIRARVKSARERRLRDRFQGARENGKE